MMKETPLINQKDVEHANQKLYQFYDNSFIPAEKKTYLTDLKSSTGPYMGIEGHDGEPHYLMDAASQIATLGLGFNSSAFFGTSHHLESWLNDFDADNFQSLREAFKSFLKRKTNWKDLHIKYCHSGAEANETALGFCYKKRFHEKANKVLAFEGSFHGRMMVSLASTWNKVKREPFEWPGFQTEFAPYPELEGDNTNVEIPEAWCELWDQSPRKDFKVKEEWRKDSQLSLEIDCLLEVRNKLLSNEIFAIIIEPMQCEGGDRYSTNRFHTALLLMARSFNISTIYDEVQTGYHLGRDFFWFRQLNLQDQNGNQLDPSYVVCAKKAQVGLVISHQNELDSNMPEEFQVASAVRGYYHALMLDQYQQKIIDLENQSREKLSQLVQKYSQYISRPRACGLSFAFDILDKDLVPKFIGLRFDHGLLYYPAGAQTLRFRLNTGFSSKDLNFLFERLDSICDELFKGSAHNPPPKHQTKDRGINHLYAWHTFLLETRLDVLKGNSPTFEKIWNQLRQGFEHSASVELNLINQENFSNYAQKIQDLQEKAYEPARQTALKNFEQVAKSNHGIALAIERNSKLMGMAFASPLDEHPLERGTREDPSYGDHNALYMLDVTIDDELRGLGLGKSLKYALSLLGMVKGVRKIQGRNRDRMAAEMLNINLSLGAYELFYRKEDYPDFQKYRDVLYYTIPLQWDHSSLNLSNGITSPHNASSLTVEHIKDQLPYINNKVCLSNFVSERFLSQLKEVLSSLPGNLQHAYTTSGQSECVDKLAKSIWYTRPENKNGYKQLTFHGHYFGGGSFLSRSLSSEQDSFFPVTRLDSPTSDNFEQILKEIEGEISKGEYLAIWLEPLMQKTMQRMPFEFLEKLKSLSDKYKVPVIYNETASQMHRYHNDGYFASDIESIRPHAGMAYLGGQAGVVFLEEDFFISKPLMLISTWDGDEFSLANYNLAARKIKNQKDLYLKTQNDFSKALSKTLEQYQVLDLQIQNGVGSFTGHIPNSLAQYFNFSNGQYLVCPSFDSMEQFLKENQ